MASCQCRAPSLTVDPTTPTTALAKITPPAGGPWSRYNITSCPVAGGQCVTTMCTTPSNRPITGLTPDTTYVTTVVAVKSNGQTSPPSNEDIFTTPSIAPILTSATAWGPTTGQAPATPPPGVTHTSVRQGAGQDLGCQAASQACIPQ